MVSEFYCIALSHLYYLSDHDVLSIISSAVEQWGGVRGGAGSSKVLKVREVSAVAMFGWETWKS